MEQTLLKLVTPVSSLDIYESRSSTNFHPQGLYSTQIFGAIGTQARSSQYSYIDLKISVFQPVFYKALIKLKPFYQDIMSGREFAIFDPNTSDFVRADAVSGFTGFDYFVTHFKKLKFEQRTSTVREQNIILYEKNKDTALTRYVYVIPAMYRDLEIDDDGRESSDEVNSLYYKAVAIAKTINDKTTDVAPEVYNKQRFSLQMAYLEIYELLLNVIKGKKNMIMGKWASRKVFNGTRNVLTASTKKVTVLGDPTNLTSNDTQVGLFQFAKAILPLTRHLIKNGFSYKIFSNLDTPATLCDPETLKTKKVMVDAHEFNQWMTNDGIETMINIYREQSTRERPIMIQGCYAGLIYRGRGDVFKFISGIDQIPQEWEDGEVLPINMTEMLYICMYARASDTPGTVTRYPVASDRSIYPSMTYLNSTIQSKAMYQLNDNWEVDKTLPVAKEFPIRGSDTFNSLSPHPNRLKKLNADHDGDTGSFIALVTEEAIAEIKMRMKQKMFFIGPDGKFVTNLNTDTVDFVLKNMSFEPQ